MTLYLSLTLRILFYLKSLLICNWIYNDHANLAFASGLNPPIENNLKTAAKCDKPKQNPSGKITVQYQNISGVDQNLQSLDIFMPEIQNPCSGVPVVIFVHGGGWMTGDKKHINYKPNYFNSLGYGFVTINYRLSPNLKSGAGTEPNRIRFPIHPKDVGTAVAWVHKNIGNYGGNPEQLALLGHSAGGHLAALVGLDQTYIQAADPAWNMSHLRCVGSYDMEGLDIVRLMRNPERKQEALYKNAFGSDPTVWAEASPLNHVKTGAPAFQLMLRGSDERRSQITEFKSALEQKSNIVKIINAHGLSHKEVNILIGKPGDQRITPYVTDFLNKTCFPLK